MPFIIHPEWVACIAWPLIENTMLPIGHRSAASPYQDGSCQVIKRQSRLVVAKTSEQGGPTAFQSDLHDDIAFGQTSDIAVECDWGGSDGPSCRGGAETQRRGEKVNWGVGGKRGEGWRKKHQINLEIWMGSNKSMRFNLTSVNRYGILQ